MEKINLEKEINIFGIFKQIDDIVKKDKKKRRKKNQNQNWRAK